VHGNTDGFGGVATQMMDAADSRMPTLSVNARRKFFHALAVVMFVPGIAVDVSSPSICSIIKLTGSPPLRICRSVSLLLHSTLQNISDTLLYGRSELTFICSSTNS